MKFRQRLVMTLMFLLSLISLMTYLATIGRRYVNIFEYITFDQQPNVLINLKHIVSDRKYQNRSTKEIGVLGTEAIGKWFGDFTCFSSGEPVRVIQSPDYRRLSNCEALFLVAGQIIPWTTLIRNRAHGQIWIFMSFESPSNTNYNYDVILSHINWTFTYLSDATFPSPYGAYYLTSQTAPNQGQNLTTNDWAKSKTALVCAVVSNCHDSWGRLETIKELAKYISTDLYGACGKKPCKHDKSCNEMLSKYKFYLAFENSICNDYITEKFWYNALAFDIVPIVYGARPDDYKRSAPPNSYIHVEEFSSLKALADYLIYLDKNDELYNQYFEWKINGYIKPNFLAEHYEPNITMCRILEKLNKLNDTKNIPDTHNKEEIISWLHSCR